MSDWRDPRQNILPLTHPLQYTISLMILHGLRPSLESISATYGCLVEPAGVLRDALLLHQRQRLLGRVEYRAVHEEIMRSEEYQVSISLCRSHDAGFLVLESLEEQDRLHTCLSHLDT